MKTAIMTAVALATFGSLVGTAWYVALRFEHLLGGGKKWALFAGVIASLLLAFTFVSVAARSTSAVIGVLNAVSGAWLVFYVFLLPSLLVLHVAHWRWGFAGTWPLVVAVVLPLFFVVVGSINASRFAVVESTIPLPRLQREVVLMHLSDMHLGHHRGREWLAQIVAETNRHRPDMVLINGDLVDSDVALEPGILAPLADFAAPVYYVGGNHEDYVDRKRVLDGIAGTGCRILHSEVVDAGAFNLVGLDYLKADEEAFEMHPSAHPTTIKDVLPRLKLDEKKPTVLIHHSPVGIEYAAARGVELMLSGHTHGGQVFPFTRLAPLVHPFNRGLYYFKKMKVFVSEGVGTFMVKSRLDSNNELNLIRLVPESGDEQGRQ